MGSAREKRRSGRAGLSDTEASELPPPVVARFFYYSDLVIDDPKSPLISSSTGAAVPARPFSVNDNEDLETAWLRWAGMNLGDDHSSSLAHSPQRPATDGGTFGSRRPSLRSRPIEIRNRPTDIRSPTSPDPADGLGTAITFSDLRHVGTSSGDSVNSGSPVISHHAVPTETKTTRMIFARVPTSDTGLAPPNTPAAVSRGGKTNPIRPESDTSSGAAQDDSSTADNKPDSFDPSEQPSDPVDAGGSTSRHSLDNSADNVPVGVSRLHHVVMPAMQLRPIYWAPIQDVANVTRCTWFYRDSMMPVCPPVAVLLEYNYLLREAWTPVLQDNLSSALRNGAGSERWLFTPLWPAFESVPALSEHQEPSEEEKEGFRQDTMVEAMRQVEKLRKKMLALYLRLRIDPGKDAATTKTSEKKGSGGSESRAGRGGPAEEHLVDDTAVSRFEREDSLACGIEPNEPQLFEDGQVIYVDKSTAFILPPDLTPGCSRRRGLLNKLRSEPSPYSSFLVHGKTVGVPVVRGFDSKAWDQLAKQKEAKNGPLPSASEPVQEPEPVTDLVLVIHGIGQKLSQRMESFHFTRAINSFRQSINAARSCPDVMPHLRERSGGVMTLPVNWRLLVSFDGDEKTNEGDPAANNYSISDITPAALRSVRDIVSDVMFDVPYYFSEKHHNEMITACMSEANGIYARWCLNNPGFHQTGRVHILAHSLGSAMAIDILSQQPLGVGPGWFQQYQRTGSFRKDQLLFNTSSLFICGSPVGFFLSLKHATLRPRSGFRKEGLTKPLKGVAGEKGEYGCLAVENIYNVINPYDPVAYKVNGTVDAAYAASLQTAFIPRERNGVWQGAWWGRQKDRDYGLFGPSARQLDSPVTGSSFERFSRWAGPQPSRTIDDLSPVVEMARHNFLRQGIAEQRMLLLNDHGQIDFFLSYGGGMFEIRYLTMLGAHSSYWTSDDFARFVVLQVGRPAGLRGCVPTFRAVKADRVRVVPKEPHDASQSTFGHWAYDHPASRSSAAKMAGRDGGEGPIPTIGGVPLFDEGEWDR